jgi:hypothetical protein
MTHFKILLGHMLLNVLEELVVGKQRFGNSQQSLSLIERCSTCLSIRHETKVQGSIQIYPGL